MYFYRTIDNTSTSGKEIVCSANSELETSNMGAHVTLNDSSVMTCDTDVSRKKSQEKKGKKRGRRFDRDCRAAELEVRCLIYVQTIKCRSFFLIIYSF